MPWRNTASQTTDVRLDPKALIKKLVWKCKDTQPILQLMAKSVYLDDIL